MPIDFAVSRREAIRYWERRRLYYNLALIPPSFFGYMLMAGLAYVGDPHEFKWKYVLFLFALSAIGANICYSFAYALEFIFASNNPSSRWFQFWRNAIFIAGVLFAMVLALIGGRNIALLEFYHK